MLPQARFAAPDAESGRDLLLVDSLAGSWGTPPTPEGKAVWFSCRYPPRVADSRSSMARHRA
ncbi:hypothetical protein ACFQ83_37875, partial [Streptomyces sp. NPDC056540]